MLCNFSSMPAPMPIKPRMMVRAPFSWRPDRATAMLCGYSSRPAPVLIKPWMVCKPPVYCVPRGPLRDVVQLLLEFGAHVNQAKDDGTSPLLIASVKGHCDVLQLLLDASASVNQAKNDGASPLFMASQQGHCDVVKVLITANANVNAITNFGASALMVSSHCGYAPIVRLLLKHGARPNTGNPQTRSPPCPLQRRQGTDPLPICSFHSQRWTLGSLLSSAVKG